MSGVSGGGWKEFGIDENVLEMTLRGRPRQPFYLVGRMGDQSAVIRGEKGEGENTGG